jgi:hypothetical protein
MVNPRRLSVALAVCAALLLPSLASASSAHHNRCRQGYQQKVTRTHHRRHVACVKKRRKTLTHAPKPVHRPTRPPAPVTPPSNNPTPPTTNPTPPAAPPSGPPTLPPALGGPPAPPRQTGQETRAMVRSHARARDTSSTSAYVGQAYAADVSCDGTLGAADFLGATGTSHEAGFLDMSPSATPGAAFSSQSVAAREWMYSYSQQSWMPISDWDVQTVSQPDPDIISVGDTSGSPFRFSGVLGNYGYVYIGTEYYWWTGSQWTGQTFALTTGYLQSYSSTDRTTNNSWCYLS